MPLNDRTLGFFALLFAIFLTLFGYSLDAEFSYEPVGPKAFPLLIALIIGICGLVLIKKGGHPIKSNPPHANFRIFTMLIYITAYAFLFQWLGFILSTSLMTIFVAHLFGGSWKKSVIGGIGMGILFFLLFDKGLDVILPTGILGDLL
ncbi:tripartite tricarboxylate transporter TctB family protein [Pelistega ratti]|uniref:tripartite tricarboxylate transporter TctB family protein n=1 Tax=Pelistega ratti TaxID=2652177 RepID=UPI0013585134|nr:tripartite tricarboxylate transporter TctB family protein [Pelistega ratti]